MNLGRHGRFYIVEHQDEIPFKKDSTEEELFTALKKLKDKLKTQSFSLEDDIYWSEATMIFKDSLFEVKININKNNGNISIEDEELIIENLPVQIDYYPY